MDYGFLLRSIIMQLVVFSIIPFLYWFIKERKNTSFFSYIGLVRLQTTESIQSILLIIICYIIVYGIVHFTPIAILTQPSANAYEGTGIIAIIPAFFVCFIQQALAEEVLFRGFIGKRLISKVGLNTGNTLQAGIFGATHVLLSISDEKTTGAYLIIMVSITAGGWLLGYLDEKIFKGSIVPSILLHGLGNYIMILSVALY
ncbi:MAG: lysostaphin resistance A-like protein [Velocimicrobium sp.]